MHTLFMLQVGIIKRQKATLLLNMAYKFISKKMSKIREMQSLKCTA